MTQQQQQRDPHPTRETGPLGRLDPKQPAAAPRPAAPPPKKVAAVSAVVVAGFVGLIGVLLLFAFIADAVREQEAIALDTWATPFLHSISSPLLDAVMTGFTTMGSSVVLVPVFVVVIAALLLSRRYGAALFFTIAASGAVVIDATMKLLFERARPKLDYAAVLPDYSFPSGHSMNGIVFYVGLALIVWSIFGRRAGIPAVIAGVLLALCIGTSRIYLGYHYFTDVVGGFLAGTAWLIIVIAAFRATPKVWPWSTDEIAAAVADATKPPPGPSARAKPKRGASRATSGGGSRSARGSR
jgi:membrane-associated phospholipid phosphatase